MPAEKKSDVLAQLATSLGRRDEAPNVELAAKITKDNDEKSVSLLIKNLANEDSNIQNDCIKVLYEIGQRNPKLVSGYANEFLLTLTSKNNRLVWGAMTALDTMVFENPDSIYSSIGKLIEVADLGSMITRDHLVSILIKLSSMKKYSKRSFPLLVEQLKKCPSNQLPMYAEQAVQVISPENKDVFLETLTSRVGTIEKESKRKRVEKVIAKLRK